MGAPAVRFSHVSKRFRIGESHDSLRDLLGGAMRRLLGRRSGPGRSSFLALRDVDFEIAPGEAVGIIGPNGAGKSTALRLLAGILRPDRGQVEVRGRLSALIEVGAGFHGDLTGRENVFLNGTILGMSRQEIRRKFDDIVAFAGVERFIDMPVKRYSSGMYARLGFSIAAHVAPDVLLVDEVLSVGDAVFRLRCLDRMRSLVRHGTTLVFVTHDLDQMQSICRRAIVLEQGAASFQGPPREAVVRYLGAMSRSYSERPTDLPAGESCSGAVELVSFRLLDRDGEQLVWLGPREGLRVELTLRLRHPITRMVLEVNVRTAAGEQLLSFNSGRAGVTIGGRFDRRRVTLDLPSLPLAAGQYFWSVRAWDAATGTTELDTPCRSPLVINDGGLATGLVCVDHRWGCEPDTPEPGPREIAEEPSLSAEEVEREDLPVR